MLNVSCKCFSALLRSLDVHFPFYPLLREAQMQKLEFDDATIERLFGAEDAENEDDRRFKEYFFFNRTYTNLVADLPIRILVGHKGIGKSALLRRAFVEHEEKSQLAVWLRPNDLVSHFTNLNASEFNQLIENWKSGLLESILREATTCVGQSGYYEEKGGFLKAGAKTVIDVLVALVKEKSQLVNNTVSKSIVQNFLKDQKIYVYIDDIDRGWDASKDSIKKYICSVECDSRPCRNGKEVDV